MQIIDELEPVKRGGYGGAIGYLSYTGDLDTAIHIRTLVVKDGVAHVQAGGGTVADARPDYEYDESVAKSNARAARDRAGVRAGGLAEREPMRVLVIDNYDSFTYNLVQYLGELGAEVEVVRNDRVDRRRARWRAAPTASSCRPDRARPTRRGSRWRSMRRCPRRACRPSACASATRRSHRRSAARVARCAPVHGKTTTIEHDGKDDLRRAAAPASTAGRYHSLVVDRATLPDCLEGRARRRRRADGRAPPRAAAEGVQFHPESVLTEHGQSCSQLPARARARANAASRSSHSRSTRFASRTRPLELPRPP